MNYTERYNELRSKYSTDVCETVKCDSSEIRIKNFSFISKCGLELTKSLENTQKNYFFNPEILGSLNNNFTYPIVYPANQTSRKGVIILLHGLNERNWDKYLPWAHHLAESTGKSIILFPIAYHMNRSPQLWIDRQLMNGFVNDRLTRIPGVQNVSFVNVALSERLTMEPQRFFLSGYQAANDVIQLVDEIRSGKNPFFAKDTTIDFFSYSIGVLLSQVLLLGDNKDRFAKSKFFFFCGGSVFEGMHGISKYIIDSTAFTRIFDYYMHAEESTERLNNNFYELFNKSVLGNTFKFLISFSKFKLLPLNLMKRFREQVQTITLKKDTIIPSDSTKETMKNTDLEEWDFNYRYSHENPFPTLNNSLSALVDKSFDLLMNKASLYLR
jgi:hypothetical protein